MYIGGTISMELRFGGVFYQPKVRMLDDMREVVYDKGWLSKAANTELYYMFRDLAASDLDKQAMKEQSIRYDNTIIPAGRLGAEYVKTTGHYHPLVPGSSLSYTEIYEVLEGVAHYLLQKELGGRITDVVLVKAEKGDKVVIPPNYGHVTINPGKKDLKMANLVSSKFTSMYGTYQQKAGAAYYELTSGKIIPNKAYEDLPPLRAIDACDFTKFGIPNEKEIYSLIHSPQTLAFLNRPYSYSALFKHALKE
jgi:glucose-6-phosphate isomerase